MQLQELIILIGRCIIPGRLSFRLQGYGGQPLAATCTYHRPFHTICILLEIMLRSAQRPPAAAMAGEMRPAKRCKLEDDGTVEEVSETGLCQPLAALADNPDLRVIVADCEAQWAAWCQKGHPLAQLRENLQDPTYRSQVLRSLVQHMKEAHPDMRRTLLQKITLTDAQQEGIGCSGEAHLFMIGYSVMKGLDWPAMWKGDPALFRLHSVWMRALTSGTGLDTTVRSLKLCVAPQMCDLEPGALAKELLFAGYTAGSTLGSACFLLAFMLLHCKASPWQLPQVRAFMHSIARVKVTFVVHTSAEARAADAWRTLGVTLCMTHAQA